MAGFEGIGHVLGSEEEEDEGEDDGNDIEEGFCIRWKSWRYGLGRRMIISGGGQAKTKGERNLRFPEWLNDSCWGCE